MKTILTIWAVIAMMPAISGAAQASITIETVTVGDPGNVPDTIVSGLSIGDVGYTYNIGKYEVTTGQYTAFLNAVAASDTYTLYNASMWSNGMGCKIQRNGSSGSYTYSVASDYADRPVNYVSFWDACRFTNWLQNGQKTGAQDASTTESGAYSFNGVANPDNSTFRRNAHWQYAVTSENEWYKAAYYKGGSTNAVYYYWPTGTGATPGRDMADASGNNANCYNAGYLLGSPYYRTVVGEFQNSDSPYGTFDQGGNVWEWNDHIMNSTDRVVRGGSFYEGTGFKGSAANGSQYMWSPMRFQDVSTFEDYKTGFRISAAVAGAPVPEPAFFQMGALLGMSGLGCLKLRRKA